MVGRVAAVFGGVVDLGFGDFEAGVGDDPVDASAARFAGPAVEGAVVVRWFVGRQECVAKVCVAFQKCVVGCRVRARIEIARDDDEWIFGQVFQGADVGSDQLCRTLSSLAATVIEVRVDHQDGGGGFVRSIAQQDPGCHAGKRRIPAFGFGNVGCLTEPEVSAGKLRESIGSKEDATMFVRRFHS